MSKLFKSKKVITALLALVIALVSVAFGVDFGVTADEVTGVGPARLILFTLLLSLAGLILAPFPGGFR